jgi:hypothetical protein
MSNLYRGHFIDASYQALVHLICPSGFREDFLEIDQSEKELLVAAMFVNRLG